MYMYSGNFRNLHFNENVHGSRIDRMTLAGSGKTGLENVKLPQDNGPYKQEQAFTF